MSNSGTPSWLRWLNEIRTHETNFFLANIPENSKILEIGAGTGIQATIFSSNGHEVVAIDVPNSRYFARRVFPIQDYDGVNIPLPDSSIDIIVSSNVLEHVENLDELLKQMHRVLRPKGYCLHAMPSVTWRLSTIFTGWLSLPTFIIKPSLQSTHTNWINFIRQYVKGIAVRLLPLPHGVTAKTAFGQLITFRKQWWCKRMSSTGFQVSNIQPMGLFYTGYGLGRHFLTLTHRMRLASIFGSAAILYKTRPLPIKFQENNLHV